MMRRLVCPSSLVLGLAALALASCRHDREPVASTTDWATGTESGTATREDSIGTMETAITDTDSNTTEMETGTETGTNDSGTKWDLSPIGDGGGDPCSGGGGQTSFSYLWVSN